MRWSNALRAAIRLVVIGGVCLCGIAVVVGRLVPEPGAAELRRIEPGGPVGVSSHLVGRGGASFVLFDPACAGFERSSQASRGRMEHLSVSPWTEAGGARQVVGCETVWSGPEKDRVMTGMGLTRSRFPGGEVLDRIETDNVPVDPPCWAPGTGALVLYPGMDGRVYRYDFEVEGEGLDGEREPEALVWVVPELEESGLRVEEVIMPSDPRMEGRLLATLCRTERHEGEVEPPSMTEIWWLELDPAWRRVTRAGRLIEGSHGQRGLNERSAVMTTTHGGEVLVAYLTSQAGADDWRLHLSQVSFEPGTGLPRVAATRGEALDTMVRPDPPMFRDGGRTVGCVLARRPGMGRLMEWAVQEFEDEEQAVQRTVMRGRRAIPGREALPTRPRGKSLPDQS